MSHRPYYLNFYQTDLSCVLGEKPACFRVKVHHMKVKPDSLSLRDLVVFIINNYKSDEKISQAVLLRAEDIIKNKGIKPTPTKNK
jgi:hypothetical protein